MKAEIKINTMIVDLVKWKIGRANDKNTTYTQAIGPGEESNIQASAETKSQALSKMRFRKGQRRNQ